MDKAKATKPCIEYVPPHIEMVEEFAGRVCQELVARSGDTRFTEVGTVKGFAAFLHVLLIIDAKQRNRDASFDSSDETEVKSSIRQMAKCSNTPPS